MCLLGKYLKLGDAQSTTPEAGSHGKMKAASKQASLVQTEGFTVVGPDLCQSVHTPSDAQTLFIILFFFFKDFIFSFFSPKPPST